MQELFFQQYETMKYLDDINCNALRRLTNVQFDLLDAGLGANINRAKSWLAQQNIYEGLEKDMALVSKYNSEIINLSNQTLDILSESRDEMLSVLEKAMNANQAKPKNETAAKPTKTAGRPARKKTAPAQTKA